MTDRDEACEFPSTETPRDGFETLSSEESSEDPAPRSRVRRALPVAVALAVLAAGGAVYLVAGQDEPPPLRLAPAGNDTGNDPGTAGMVAGVAVPEAADQAPWPPPRRFVLRTRLPEGPRQASVHRLTDRDDLRAAAERLARALGLGDLREQPGAWVASGDRGTLWVGAGPGHPWTYHRAPRPCPRVTPPPRLTPQPRDPADPVMPRDPVAGQVVPKACAWGEGTRAVSPEEALRAARPVLAAVGLADASPSVRPGGGATTVAVDPKVGGLPTQGYRTAVTVTGHGVITARGWLADTAEGASYPVVDARTAFDRLNQRWGLDPGFYCPSGSMPPQGGGARPAQPRQSGQPAQPALPARPDPAGQAGDPDQPVSHPASPAPSPVATARRPAYLGGEGGGFQRIVPGRVPPRWCDWTYVIERAEFGLALRWQDRQPLLVPAWLFSGVPDGPANGVPATLFPHTFPQVAVESEYLATPSPAASAPPNGPEQQPVPEPAEPGDSAGDKVRVESAAVRGNEVTLTFFGGQESGLCRTEYAASVQESADRVVVAVIGTMNPPPNVRCVMIAVERRLSVRLARPLGDRKLVDASDNHEIARQP